ncbi:MULTISPECIES: hypothetical protein [Pandoraea]|uniref:DUF4157 domain-containing protein n=2 Tax=Pandoraea TaxID=93217 RepID=A0A5E4XEX1_9BURK|nr:MULTISPECIES: hypothetical protein [Pandoraea]VVE17091.1 hypothetical protein PCE31107_02952 [Pandoraea cepalis]VVE34867.1 hypothetical protein PTE31013_03872 [Pandoraea terrigena]
MTGLIQDGFLESILPKTLAWASEQAKKGLAAGRALTPAELDDARQVGVSAPEKIRLSLVDEVPIPDDPQLRDVAIRTGMLTHDIAGLALGYAIFITPRHLSRRLLTHECRHVHQYEVAGSIDQFMREYLRQIMTFGYLTAPLEIDATQHELV